MRRSILVAQALALAAGCRAEPREAPPNERTAGGSLVVQSSIDAATPEDRATPDVLADAQRATPDDSGATSLVTIENVTVADARAIVRPPNENCADANPDGRRCRTVGARCFGSQSHCAGGGSPRVAPRCGGSQWSCSCDGQSGAPTWQCQLQMHAAGPMPPPELSERAYA
jgi:hypothetical protein